VNATIRVGDWGSDVTRLQMALAARDYLPATGVDGIFGRQTKTALVAYQRHEGLDVDGICGPKTWARLGYASVVECVFQGQPPRVAPVKRIVLHHTVTRSVADTIKVLNWRGLSTHYIVGPSGDVHETLDPAKYRARHVGLGKHDDSVGIDVVNPLDVDVDDRSGHWDRIGTADWAPQSDGGQYRLDTDAAIEATWALCVRLCERFPKIELQCVWDYRTLSNDVTATPGVWAHGQLSDKRWDGFPMLAAWEQRR